MKNNIHFALTFLAFLGGLLFSTAQEFVESQQYEVVNVRSSGQEEEGVALIDIVIEGTPESAKATFRVTDYKQLSNVQISTLSNSELEDIREIIKVRLEYYTYCSRTEDHYFLVTKKQDLIALPSIETQYGYYPITAVSYIFPNQEFGQEGTIIRAELKYIETYIVKDIDVLQSFVWNDDNFNNEDARIAINE